MVHEEMRQKIWSKSKSLVTSIVTEVLKPPFTSHVLVNNDETVVAAGVGLGGGLAVALGCSPLL